MGATISGNWASMLNARASALDRGHRRLPLRELREQFRFGVERHHVVSLCGEVHGHATGSRADVKDRAAGRGGKLAP